MVKGFRRCHGNGCHLQRTASPPCEAALLVYRTKPFFRSILPWISNSFIFSKTQVVEIMEIIMMNGDKTPKGKQAGPSMYQNHELIFTCRESDLTTSLPSSTQKADSCSLSHTHLPQEFPDRICTVAQGVEVKPAHCTAPFRMC